MTPEQEIARTKKLVSSAKAILAGEIGLSVGVFRISNNFYYLETELKSKYPIFKQFESELPADIPVGSPRLLWEHTALLKTDLVLNSLEQKHRTSILEACIDIIRTKS